MKDGPDKESLEDKVDSMMNLSDDPELTAAVDEILARESDMVLAHDDARKRAINDRPPQKRTLKTLALAWWRNKKARYGTLAGLAMLLLAVGFIPGSRYFVLNAAHVRTAASLTIVDDSTQLPLKNVAVELGSHQTRTNSDGIVKLAGLPLGAQSLTVTQTGFAPLTQQVTLGLGSNPLGNFRIKAVGLQFRFKVVDYLSGKAVGQAEVNSDDSNAQADAKGEAVLTVGKGPLTDRQATISADGYRSEKLSLQTGRNQNQAVNLVPAAKEVYVSKASGKYDLYKADIDGKNRQVLLPASGLEDAEIGLISDATGDKAALVSRRENVKDQDGYTLQNLSVIDVSSGDVLTLDRSQQIRLVDWIGSKLIYIKVKAGTSAGNPERFQLISYDYDSATRLQLAGANYFSDVFTAGGAIYYSANNNYQGGSSQVASIKPDASSKRVILDKVDAYNLLRTDYGNLLITSYNASYNYKLGASTAGDATQTTNYPPSHNYYDSPDLKNAAWIDERDGKAVLLLHGVADSKDKVLTSDSGITGPIRWLNNKTLMYRVVRPSEVADYAISLDGGAARKVTDLTNSFGLGSTNHGY